MTPKRPSTYTVLTRWLPLVAYCLAIFIQSSGSAPDTLPDFPLSDKLLHAAAYALLAVLFYRAYRSLWPRRPFVAGLSTLSAVIYGAFDELHQSTVPMRSADGFDLLADAVGAGIGMLLYWQCFRDEREPERRHPR